MGSFAYTCAVSGLPIHCGDKVRYLLLTENPYTDSSGCYIHDQWFPRCFPLRAEYNDYGSVENVETGPAQNLWLAGLKRDLVEQGWGDNSCHDVPTSKDMSFEELLNAVQEGRVLVQRDLGRTGRSLTAKEKKALEPHIQKEVPTLQRILALFKEKDLPIYRGMGAAGGGYMVDEVQHGVVRVRFQSWGEGDFGQDEKFLRKIQPVLNDYATVIVAGSGSYAHSADLLVMVKPNGEHVRSTLNVEEDPKKPLRVTHAMIREDVWQALLDFSVEAYIEDAKTKKSSIRQVGLPFFKEAAQTFLETCVKGFEEHKAQSLALKALTKKNPEAKKAMEGLDLLAEMGSYLYLSGRDSRDSIIGEQLGKDQIPFTVGLGTNFRLMLEGLLEGKVKKAQMAAWLDAATEFIFISNVLVMARYWWRPSFSAGPQFGEFRLHQKVNAAFADIAKRIAQEEEKQ